MEKTHRPSAQEKPQTIKIVQSKPSSNLLGAYADNNIQVTIDKQEPKDTRNTFMMTSNSLQTKQ